jgi:hypothetical protein
MRCLDRSVFKKPRRERLPTIKAVTVKLTRLQLTDERNERYWPR